MIIQSILLYCVEVLFRKKIVFHFQYFIAKKKYLKHVLKNQSNICLFKGYVGK